MTTVDTIKATFTYSTALVVVLGGGVFLFLTRGEPESETTALVIAGFIGVALQFVFGSEVQTRTARQTTTAATQGATLHANGLAGTPAGVAGGGLPGEAQLG